MTLTDQIMQQCRSLVSDPACRTAYLLERKSQYAGLVGYFSNYIPPEIIAVAGFCPVRIIGTLHPGTAPRHPLPNPVCSFVQDVYAAAVSDRFAHLDAVVFPNSCDSLKLLRQRWGDDIRQPAALSLLHPVQADDSAVHYFADQLRRFADELKNRSGIEFTEAELSDTIAQYNRTRDLLRQVYDIRKTNKAFLSGSQIITLVTAGMVMDRDAYNQILEQFVLQTPPASPPDKRPKNILLIGPVTDNLRLLEQIEQRGLCIVDDDLTNGRRAIGQNVHTEGDLYHNLAESCLHSAPSPTLYTDPQSERAAFQARLEALKPDGVLFVIQKGCEPHLHNFIAKAEWLKQKGIPVQRLDIEHDAAQLNERQILQLESFLEVIGSRM